MKLLIVGGTGVLSTAVVKEALAHGIEVTVINRGHRPERIPAGVRLIKADIQDTETLKSHLTGVHFDAAIDFICYNKTQIAHSLDLFKGCVEQYIFISSACVYDTSIPGPKKEDAPKGFKSWSYSMDKWESEQYLTTLATNDGLNYTIVRPCITYDDTRIPYGIMPAYGYHWTLIGRILSGKSIITWDGGKARWNMMRVEDFAVGLVGLIGNPKAYGEAFNICGDDAYSWSEVLDTLGKVLGKEVIRLDVSSEQMKMYCPGRAGEISGRTHDAVIDNAKIKDIVPQFNQTLSLEDGIKKTLEAYKNQNFQKGIDWRFDALWDHITLIEQSRKHRLNTCFINYIGTASLKDRLIYLQKKYSL